MHITPHKKSAQQFKRRILFIVLIISLVATLLIARLITLQLTHRNRYQTLSQKNILSEMPRQPRRGRIYDRHGVVLAENIPVYSLDLIPGKVHHLPQTLNALQALLNISTHDKAVFYRLKATLKPFDSVPLILRLTPAQMAIYYVNRYRFTGTVIHQRWLRHYPFGPLLSHVLGYVARVNAQDVPYLKAHHIHDAVNVGKNGIERDQEMRLRGTPGADIVEINANGKIIRILKRQPAISGTDLYLTIDSRLQAYAAHILGQHSGAIVALQPQTGQILALVSHPSYDPNLFVKGISNQAYQSLIHQPNHPLYNRPLSGLYAPGSTIKPFLAIGALDRGTITQQDKIYDRGRFQLPGTQHIYHDWYPKGHGWVNVTKAIVQSCDTFFYHLATLLTIHGIDQVLQQFGFGQPTGLPVSGEKSGIIPSPAWKKRHHHQAWFAGDTVITGIGQGFMLVTPIQLATATSVIAERGQQHLPQLILKSVSPNTTIRYYPSKSRPPVRLTRPEIWSTVIHAMEQVIDSPHGTARYFGAHPGYQVAAKTGTAQVFGTDRNEERDRTDIPKQLRNNHLFICFAPVVQPNIVLVVVVEHASFADVMAGKIIRYYERLLATQPTRRTQQ